MAVPLLLDDSGVDVERPIDGFAEVAMPDMICFAYNLESDSQSEGCMGQIFPLLGAVCTRAGFLEDLAGYGAHKRCLTYQAVGKEIPSKSCNKPKSGGEATR